MKRLRTSVGLAVMICLAAGSATVVFGQMQDQGSPMPTGLPAVPTLPPRIATNVGAVVGPIPSNTGVVVPSAATNVGAVVAPNAAQTVTPPPTTPMPPAVAPPTVLQGDLMPAAPKPFALPPATLPTAQAPFAVPAEKLPAVPSVVVPETKQGQMEVTAEAQGQAGALESATGHQEPAVSVEWVGPATARLNQATAYQIIAKNISSSAVHNVIVRYRIPGGVRVSATAPPALNEGSVLTWDLGMLLPAQEKRVELQMLPEAKAIITCQASVTFTGSATFKVQVREPKLAIKATAPEHVVLGDIATVSLTVTNPGDGTAERVKVQAALPEGLEHARGRSFELDLGSLAPGENRTVQLVCLARAAGAQQVDCVAMADTGLSAKDMTKVDVVLPRLDLNISGPKLRYLDRHAVYVLTVSNPGSAAASNVSIVHQLPQGFKFNAASNGGRHDFTARTVTWFIGDLAAGESREVTLETVAASLGEHRQTAVATAARGLKTESEIMTKVEGLSALLMELVDTDDPIEVGAETSYEIRVTNTGSKTETNLELVCTVPDKMEFRGAKCAAGCKFRVEGHEVIFEALPRLAPRADVLYRVVVRGVAPGDMRFRARIRADGLSEPVLREESTKVYGD